MDDGKVVRLVNESDLASGRGVSTWLRALADQIDSESGGNIVGAAVIFNVSYGDKFCCQLRRTNMSFLETIGALRTVAYDLFNS